MNLSSFTILSSATLKEAAQTISGNASRTAIVVSSFKEQKVIGIVSEGDIVRALLADASIHTPVQEIMKRDFTFLTKKQSEDRPNIRSLFLGRGFGLLPIVDEDMQLLSVVTMLDFLREES